MKPGDKFILTDDALENYGNKYNKTYTISNVYHNDKEHRGYDMGVYPMKLYEANDLPFALYDWEILPA